MIRSEPIIGVNDVIKSSLWYQNLLNCYSSHGGNIFEILTDQDENIFLCLHKWGEHDHPTLKSPQIQPGNGLIIYLKVDNLNIIWENANKLNIQIEEPLHLNINSCKEEFSVRDLDGYYLIISS